MLNADSKPKEKRPPPRRYLSNLDSSSSKEGRPRRSNNGTLRSEIGAAGEVKPLLEQVSDLPATPILG